MRSNAGCVRYGWLQAKAEDLAAFVRDQQLVKPGALELSEPRHAFIEVGPLLVERREPRNDMLTIDPVDCLVLRMHGVFDEHGAR